MFNHSDLFRAKAKPGAATNGARTDEPKLAKSVPDALSIRYPFPINNSLHYYYPSPRSNNRVWIQKQSAMQSIRFLRIPRFPPNVLFFHLLPLKPISEISIKNFSSQIGSSPSSSSSKLLFRQLFEKESSTYTYLLANVSHPDKPAIVISLSFLCFVLVIRCLNFTWIVVVLWRNVWWV